MTATIPATVSKRLPVAARVSIPKRGIDGVTFTPAVSTDGVLSWANNGGLDNPEPVNLVDAVLPAVLTALPDAGEALISYE